ncbi:FecR family protein [Mucilaginibacter oryzae]|uniref:FecR family protein n=1 Tax=Mucilaginibacter oryzae TaxID=468058 RepID=A0A316H6J2_9SPHI|nr:FecR family protein [Mucilaginibacter oryzae]PWK75993.1 FecR family protein [Mucilaginibacter oryzae]
MDPQELKNLIDRYLKNNVTEQERKLVDEWYQSYNETDEQVSAEKEQHIKSGIYGYVKSHVTTPTAKIRRLNIFSYAAAAAIILLVGAGLLVRRAVITRQQQQQQAPVFATYKTKTGQVKKLELPDGSTVWLNALSSIRIGTSFNNTATRKVYLDEGEAFFEVKHDAAHPFLVVTNSVTTKVLGTSFNVKAYSQLNYVAVTLRTGHVEVSDKHGKMAVLMPNQRATYTIGQQAFVLSKYNGEKSRGWIEGRTALSNASFRELAMTVNNIYGVKVTSANNQTDTYKYNIIITSQHTVDETMRLICSIHKNSSRRRNNEVTVY